MSAVDDNDSGVNEEINLNDIDTDAKFRKLEKQADKAERDAIRAEKARKKTEEEVQKSADVLRQYEEREERARTASPLHAMGGNFTRQEAGVSSLGTPTDYTEFELPTEGIFTTGDLNAGNIVKGANRDKSSRSPFGASELGRADYIEAIIDNRKKIKHLETEQAMIKANQQQVLTNIRGGFGKVQQGFSWSKSPLQMAKSTALGKMAMLGFYGAIASLVIQQVESLYNQIVQEVKDMFKAGGVLDIRKDVLNEMKQIAELDTLVDVNQGRIFFTSANGESLRQGIPQTTNTMRRVNGYKQYIQEWDR